MDDAFTKLLESAAAGNDSATDAIMDRVYPELRQLAAALFRDQGRVVTLQPTALVHEAYVRLVGQEIAWSSRAQFLAVAAKAMRSALVDHARSRGREKRGGGWRRVTLALADATPANDDAVDLAEIDEAITALAELDPRKAALVELRFFGGLTADEAAAVVGIARSTAAEEWRVARAWLHHRLDGGGA